MGNLYWVGPRQSDIDDTGALFRGSITIFGDNKKKNNISYCDNLKRINHNKTNPDCDSFIIKRIEKLCEEDPGSQFMFYNPMFAYQCGSDVRKHCVCLNPYSLLIKLSNKQRSRLLVEKIIDTIPFSVFSGADCNYKSFCCFFPGETDFIVQKRFSSGGEGTFHVKSSTDCDFINTTEEYIVSPFIKNAIPVNVHLVIFEDNVVLLPPSVQIVIEIEKKMLYCGADYICINQFHEEQKNLIVSKANEVGLFLKKHGYRGIIGIDLIVASNKIYFVEFNTRFQASSQLINKALFEQTGVSLQSLNLIAFQQRHFSGNISIAVNYSNYTYINSNTSKSYIEKILDSQDVFEIQLDGFCQNCWPKERNTYLFRCIFNQNICSYYEGALSLHPNLFFEDVKKILKKEKNHFEEYIKIALLNHGISFSAKAIANAKTKGSIKHAVFDAVDAIIFDGVYINIPCDCKFNSLSPFTIDWIGENFVLLLDGDIISNLELFFVPDSLNSKYTSTKIPYDAIINLATDRIRINPAPICFYKSHHMSCKFCNLPLHNYMYDIDDIKETIDYCLSNVEFRHFLIGGGTYALNDKAWEIIISIANYIHRKCNKDIYLMSLPPKDNNILPKLKDAGITEVAFNLEVFDRNKAKIIMPGKGEISMEHYLASLRHATTIWGKKGKVRSLLIYGFDSDTVFLNGIETLCKNGIEPIISVFRPLYGSDYYYLNPPKTLDIINVYHICIKIAAQYGLILGPDCPMCQNNTLSFSNSKKTTS